MASGIVVGSVFLAGDELFGVVDLAIGASTYFINHSGFKIDENASRDMLTSSSLAEEGVERVFGDTDALVRRHLAILMNAMLQTEELPAGIAHLNAGLAAVDINHLSHFAEIGVGNWGLIPHINIFY